MVQATGRINNLGTFDLENGKLARGRHLVEHSIRLAEEIGNTQIVAYGRAALSLYDRKQGRHRDTTKDLGELLRSNESVRQNRHVRAEIYIELAKHFNYRLFPQRALDCLAQCKAILTEDVVHHSFVDFALALGWTWIVLGLPERALKEIAKLDLNRIRRERGRYFLLRARTQLCLGSTKRAWKEVCSARREFPEYMPYYRAKSRLLQGRIVLEAGNVLGAKQYVEEGLTIAKSEFYFPLMVESYLLYARGLSETGEFSLARTYCQRALQVARRVERPGLRAETCHTLGKVESKLGNREAALQRMAEGLQIVKERLLHVSPEYRGAFVKQYVNPIETSRDQLLPATVRSAPNYFIRLRELTNTIRETHSQAEIGETTLQIASQSLADISVNFLGRKFPGGPFQVAASRGRCRKSGKHLLSTSWSGEQIFVPDEMTRSSDSGEFSLGISLRLGNQLAGLIYLERSGRRFSEEEIDFLNCVAGLAENQLASLGSTEGQVEKRHSLRVNDTFTIIGEHPAMQKLFDEIRRVAKTTSTVLISGESGTGKELVARAIHALSERRGQFLPVNCSAFPEDLIESELFGHSQGSFTGAFRNQQGVFEAASRGTLFLDEIATMTTSVQSRLLRVLQDKKVRRLGETRERSVDVRIVAATNQPLLELTRKGQFREDLYHRLNVYQIRVPPLRERPSDISLLVYHMLQGLNRREQQEKGITDNAVSMLSEYKFPGNVRELENILESAYYLGDGDVISAREISKRVNLEAKKSPDESLVEALYADLVAGRVDFWQAVRDSFMDRELSRDQVRQLIARGLRACNGNYRQLVEYFNMPDRDYKKFLGFLTNHRCKVDFRPYRRKASA